MSPSLTHVDKRQVDAHRPAPEKPADKKLFPMRPQMPSLRLQTPAAQPLCLQPEDHPVAENGCAPTLLGLAGCQHLYTRPPTTSPRTALRPHSVEGPSFNYPTQSPTEPASSCFSSLSCTPSLHKRSRAGLTNGFSLGYRNHPSFHLSPPFSISLLTTITVKPPENNPEQDSA